MKAIIYAFALIAMAILSGCQRVTTGLSVPEPTLVIAPPTVTVSQPTSTPTIEPTIPATASPTPTPQPLTKDRIIIGEAMTITIQGQAPIIVVPNLYTDESVKFFSNWKNSVALVNPRDVYGNMIIDIHSGYDPDGCQKLPAEDLRVFIQGRVGCGALSSNDAVTEDGIMTELVNVPVTISQGIQDSSWFIGSIQRVKHQDAKQFRLDTYRVVDSLVEQSQRDGYDSTFLIGKEKHGLIAIISLRAPDNSTTQGEDRWSYEVLAIGFYPKN